MLRHALIALATCVAVTACAKPDPIQQIVDDAAAALGGRDRVLAVKTIVIEGGGTNGNLGQDMTPDATGQAFVLSNYKRSIDVAAGRARTEQTRTPNFAYFQGQQPQTQLLGIDKEIAYNVAPNGTATRASNAAARDRRAEFYHHPVTIVRAALAPGAKLANPRALGDELVLDVTTAGGLVFTLAIGASTKLPTRVVSVTDNPNLGDVDIETTFADYQDVGGIKLPTHLTTKTDNFTTAEIRAAKQSVDADTGDLAAPAVVQAAAPVTGPPPATVTAQEIAKGLWFLAGQSHNSVLVEFSDHLALIEAPQNDTRALAVIAKARELRPGKPLTQVVVSHHHFDHSGGVRAAVSEGLGVIAHKDTVAFYQDIISRKHRLAPDALTKNLQPLKIQAVEDELEIKDSAKTMRLFHVAGNPHAATLLMAYFPAERVLVEADAYSPGAAVQPYAANLLENIRRRNLKVDRIVPLHGAIVPFSELATAQPSTH
jgi:glyoxylase-like metal-dependent hydrolase (beta-lactamase superfamily II)